MVGSREGRREPSKVREKTSRNSRAVVSGNVLEELERQGLSDLLGGLIRDGMTEGGASGGRGGQFLVIATSFLDPDGEVGKGQEKKDGGRCEAVLYLFQVPTPTRFLWSCELAEQEECYTTKDRGVPICRAYIGSTGINANVLSGCDQLVSEGENASNR